MGYNLLINGIYWVYNPLTNLLLASWDIQVLVCDGCLTIPIGSMGWDWYIYLHEWLIFIINVGKYTIIHTWILWDQQKSHTPSNSSWCPFWDGGDLVTI